MSILPQVRSAAAGPTTNARAARPLRSTCLKPICGLLVAVIAGAFQVSPALADGKAVRSSDHAPIGVMADHTHHEGEVMFSYRYMRMGMQGNRSGTSAISTADVHNQGYMVSPTSMDMEMHMAGVMYAPHERITLMAMVPYVDLSMDHRMRTGMTFTTESSGLGDITLGALTDLLGPGSARLVANLSFSAPTGDHDRHDATPMNPNTPLPYPMQLGSGTWDFQPGLTWADQAGAWSWGAQTGGVVRLGTNGDQYKLGNRVNLSAWLAWGPTETWSISGRIRGERWGDVHGRDADLNPMMVPTADPALRGGKRVDALAGLNVLLPWMGGSAHRVALEGGAPIYQDLDGPQLETDWILQVGWQYSLD